ncbi:MAG: VCBS repeat-containing protein, partial [Bacteroidales bacterium]|nr:VCBS repeat-containing protein [Bacteroidales bacterium]
MGAKTIFSDNAVSGINLDKKESYYFDGNRLFVKSGFTYGALNAEYETENKTYFKIKQTGVSGGYPSKFEITSKDGILTEYAQAVNPTGSSQPALWLVTKISDNNGNYTNYNYKSNRTATQTVVDYIEYSANTGISPAFKIQFGYGTNNSDKHYIAGYYFLDHYLLTGITVTCASAQIRKYAFTYEYRDGKRFLTAIELEGENGEKLPATAIEWGEDNKVMETQNINIPTIISPINKQRFFAADFSGDGVSDLVRIFHSENVNRDFAHFNKSNKDGSFDLSTVIAFDSEIFWSDVIRYQGNSMIANFGVNNRSFILPQYQQTGSTGEVHFNIYQQIDKGTDVENPLTVIRPLSSTAQQMPVYTVADFNNDGKDEIVYIERTNSSHSVTIPNFPAKILYNKGEVLMSSDVVFETSSCKIVEEDLMTGAANDYILHGYTSQMIAFDFNSDGLKDILSFVSSHWRMFKNNGGTTGSDGITRVTFSDVTPYDNQSYQEDDIVYGNTRTGDFNGDGLMDFITYNGIINYTYMYIADGNLGFIKRDISDDVTITNDDFSGTRHNDTDDNKDDMIVTDFNYDGNSDIIIVDANLRKECSWHLFGACMNPYAVYDNTDIRWYVSNGASFTEHKHINLTSENYYYKGYTAAGDFDGDGREDLFCFNGDLNQWDQSSNAYIYNAFNTGFAGNLITGITDGMGNKTSINYQPLTYPEKANSDIFDVSYFYVKGTTAGTDSLSTVDIQASLYCVSGVSSPVSATEYSYKGLKGNVKGKGLLGFTEISANDTLHELKSITKIEMDYEKCLPKLQKQAVTDLWEYNLSVVANYFKNSKSGNIYISMPDSTIEADWDRGLHKTTKYIKYDNYGNLLASRTIQGNMIKTDSISYIQKGSWCSNKPASIQTVSSYQNLKDTIVKTFAYDSKGNLTQEILHPDKAPFKVITAYSNYDLFGHARSVSV